MIRPQRVVTLIVLMLTLVGLLTVPVWAQTGGSQSNSEEVPFEPVGQVMRKIADSEEIDKETIANALRSFMDGLLAFLEEKGVPETALSNIQTNFQNALDQFVADRMSTDNFGAKIANVVRQIQTEAQLQGIDGIPSKVLESAGIPSDAVEQMQRGNVPDPTEIPEMAESAANASEQAEDKGKPEDPGPPDNPGEQGDDESDDQGDDNKGNGDDKGEEGEDNSDNGNGQGDDNQDNGDENKDDGKDNGQGDDDDKGGGPPN